MSVPAYNSTITMNIITIIELYYNCLYDYYFMLKLKKLMLKKVCQLTARDIKRLSEPSKKK